MKGFKFILGIAFVLFLVSACSGPRYKYHNEVTYQYENEENINHIMTFDDYYSFKSTVKDFDVSYSFPAGYINKLTVVATVTVPGSCGHSYSPRELMYVPDRRFKVIDIKVTREKAK